MVRLLPLTTAPMLLRWLPVLARDWLLLFTTHIRGSTGTWLDVPVAAVLMDDLRVLALLCLRRGLVRRRLGGVPGLMLVTCTSVGLSVFHDPSVSTRVAAPPPAARARRTATTANAIATTQAPAIAAAHTAPQPASLEGASPPPRRPDFSWPAPPLSMPAQQTPPRVSNGRRRTSERKHVWHVLMVTENDTVSA